MNVDLVHVAGRVFNAPLLMSASRLRTAVDATGGRILAGSLDGQAISGEALSAALSKRNPSAQGHVKAFSGGAYYAGGGVGVFPIVGTLVRRGSWIDAECGLISYGVIRQGFDEMLADPSVRGVLLELDTPGGEAGGCFDLGRHMRAAAEAAGKPLWAHANELAASAGYAIASAASKFWLATTAEVGSIGVVAAHIDMSKADEKAGLKWTYIFEGDRKVDGNPHEPLSDAAAAAIREDVRGLYDMFVDLVASHRTPLTAKRIKDAGAVIYRGAVAVEAGFADEVGSLEDALDAFAKHLQAADGAKPSAQRTAQRNSPARQAAASEAIASERARAIGLGNVAAMAKRHGVTMDAAKLVANPRITVASARGALNEALIRRDEEVGEIMAIAPGSEGSRANRTRNAWRDALKRR